MKTLRRTGSILLFILPLFVTGQTDKSLAKVNLFAGKEVYYNSDPLNLYSIVYRINTVLPAPTLMEKFNVSFAVNYMINKAMEKYSLERKDFDGIITIEGSSTDVAIKFNQPVDSSKQRLTRVHRCGDKYVFVLCEPVNTYDVVFEINAKPVFPVSIVQTVMKKASHKWPFGKGRRDFDGIIIGYDKTHYAIKFK